MTLNDELYFEITLEGDRGDLDRFVSFLLSGELDDFFEISPDYICYDDNYNTTELTESTTITFANDEYGIQIDSFNPEDFLDIFCSAAQKLDVSGNFFDADDEEYRFVSPAGNSYYTNVEDIDTFNDELDAEALKEEYAFDEEAED